MIDDPANIGRPTITPSFAFNEQLKVFDIDPGVKGSHEGTADSDRLVVTAGDTFAGDALVTATLRNLTDGSRCVLALEDISTNGRELSCELQGGEENDWDNGDRFEVGGNPLALLTVVLDNLDLVLAQFDETPALDNELPLIGRSPRQLVKELRELRDQIDDFRNQQPLAQVVCTLEDPTTGQPAANPTSPLINLQDGDRFFCQGRRLTSAPELIEWSVEGAAVVADEGLATSLTTVAVASQTPSAWMPFRVTQNDANPGLEAGEGGNDDFRVRLELRESGRVHPVHLPITPLSLQNLGDLLACHLGLPEGVLSLSIEDLPLPAGAPGPNPTHDLVVGLQFGLCTQNSGPDGILGTDDDVANDQGDELACNDTSDRLIEQPAATVHLEMPSEFDGSELVGLDAMDPQLKVEARAAARLGSGHSPDYRFRFRAGGDQGYEPHRGGGGSLRGRLGNHGQSRPLEAHPRRFRRWRWGSPNRHHGHGRVPHRRPDLQPRRFSRCPRGGFRWPRHGAGLWDGRTRWHPQRCRRTGSDRRDAAFRRQHRRSRTAQRDRRLQLCPGGGRWHHPFLHPRRRHQQSMESGGSLRHRRRSHR